jgi:hypothetical protein
MSEPAISVLRSGADRLRRGALWVIFALVLIIPRVNRLRGRRRAWNFVRLIVALVGAAMLVFSAAHGYALGSLIAGALMMLFALVMRAARSEASIDARARELGALIAVDGGRYFDAGGRPHRAKLFVGPSQIWVLDAALHILLETPLAEVRMLVVEPSGEGWRFRVHGEKYTTELNYEGPFAQHLATVADATIRSQLNRELPVLR